MREIKFRGKRVDNGEWVYGYYIIAGGMAFISAFGIKEPVLVIPETVGQYTGLKDKNGKEIYEGDWVMVIGRNIDGYIVYSNDIASFMIEIDSCDYEVLQYYPEKREVIGNVHEEVR